MQKIESQWSGLCFLWHFGGSPVTDLIEIKQPELF
jgi:hypothetical protein